MDITAADEEWIESCLNFDEEPVVSSESSAPEAQMINLEEIVKPSIDWSLFRVRLNQQDKSVNASIFFDTEMTYNGNVTKPVAFTVVLEHLKEHKVNSMYYKLHEIFISILMSFDIRTFASTTDKVKMKRGLKKAINIYNDNVEFMNGQIC